MLSLAALLALTVLAAALDWFAVARGWRRVEVIAKPVVMVLLFLWVWFATGLQGAMLYFGLGILFSLAGDIFLLVPARALRPSSGQTWFLAGLAAFLLAHVSYIIGFNLTPPGTDLFGALTAILVAVLMARLYRRIAAGLVASGQGHLRLPVLVYTFAIALMLVSALLTLYRPDWLPIASLLAASGAGLFVASDAVLAQDRFVTPVKNGRLIVMVLYHLGQILLIVGVKRVFYK